MTLNLTNVYWWIGSIALKAGNKTDPSPRIMRECDFRSITSWIWFHFSFSMTVQSHSKSMKGYKLLELRQKDIKDCVQLHKYRHKYM